jgi:hypothetical protein
MTTNKMSLDYCHPERSEGSIRMPKGVNRPRKNYASDSVLDDSSHLSE